MNIKKIIILFLSVFVIFSISCKKNPIKELFRTTEDTIEIIIGTVSKTSIEMSTGVITSGKDYDRVKSISSKLVKYADRDISYKFKVLNLPYPNAFAVPGGFIYITKKLVQMTNDDELACVIGHEIGHVEARHSIKAFEKQLIYSKILDYYSKKSNTVDKNKDLIMIANTIFNELRFSRENEREADRFGVDFAIAAGYNPYGMITFFKKLNELEGGEESGALKILRTHPLTSERIDYTGLYIKKRLQ
ncbi:MAG: M48 family metalloprotease [Candidatus Muirbacterium halophilum]|nr:M48 family metalloprotease [Candidatus Muirbacterium halophilum]MCK9476180.1 M48 family metalloprotease [Candidatus Muirbacterium halophilum]